MSKLDDFLNLTDVSEIRETIVEKIDGKELEFVIKPMSKEQHSEFQKRCNSISKKGTISFDAKKYSDLVLENCIVEPNFSDESFLKKAKCVCAPEFINKKFPAGIVSDIVEKITELSGFESLQAEIEEAKN